MPGVDPNRAIGRPVLQTRDASDTLQIMKQGKCQVANREPTPPGTVEVAVNTPRGSSSSTLNFKQRQFGSLPMPWCFDGSNGERRKGPNTFDNRGDLNLPTPKLRT